MEMMLLQQCSGTSGQYVSDEVDSKVEMFVCVADAMEGVQECEVLAEDGVTYMSVFSSCVLIRSAQIYPRSSLT
uniref:Uncharacterized protein n=1 Tax=Ascaris lumbricoides TaxID=6252 RepID=A0A0M3HT74_ASCLU